jgi:hypothetical protein
MKKMLAVLALLTLSSPTVAKPLVLLECEIPKLVAPGRNMVWEKWHGFIEIADEVWSINDYAFYPAGLKGLQGSMAISRSSGTLTVDTPRATDGTPLQRIGTCKRVTKEENRF